MFSFQKGMILRGSSKLVRIGQNKSGGYHVCCYASEPSQQSLNPSLSSFGASNLNLISSHQNLSTRFNSVLTQALNGKSGSTSGMMISFHSDQIRDSYPIKDEVGGASGGMGGGDDKGNGSSGGGSGGGGGAGDSGSNEEDEGPVLSFKEVEAFMKERNIKLPNDMLEIAKQGGLRLACLNAYASSHNLPLVGFLVRTVPFLRDRILADPLFLFKIGVELVIDSACTTIAEVRKRGEDFWGEFELYLSDLFVGLVLDIALVSLMAPAMVLGSAARAARVSGLKKLLAQVPSAVFAPSVPGAAPYTIAQRLSCLLVKFGEYSLAGIACGLVGTAIANAAMEANRSVHGSDENAVMIPPLGKTALVWGLFLGVSANIRYQIVFGIERLVDMTIAKRVPQVAYATTVGVRFCNNVIGGENFIDMARWAGVQ
ncbi:hypothetical protein CEUSTIGMA_g11271.t1 [Chlamydomonas eustigma]|uniref:Uncharacterized protein n=1 Tax=Chlamydomonas eustigma TaxID=1157962 RepID=A0A250XL99_9CHLO|nr:hypothetical protein CEUSTIGMA_g11271.t1 [Chlamydomonas eustigma]|eukprot:GAX83847.1 hypothetical protein CEUSTIGMA_g11271.t1 [Chlamydomonas eustigma]